MSAALRATPSLLARLGRTVGIALVFVAAGPPIGGFALLLLSASLSMMIGPSFPGSDLTMPQLGLVLTVIFFSYFFGAGPAALVGLAIGIKQAFFGSTTWRLALLLGLVAGAVFAERMGAMNFSGVNEALFILTCVIPTMLCWVIVRDWYLPSTTEAAL
jgi:hypothetical protein